MGLSPDWFVLSLFMVCQQDSLLYYFFHCFESRRVICFNLSMGQQVYFEAMRSCESTLAVCATVWLRGYGLLNSRWQNRCVPYRVSFLAQLDLCLTKNNISPLGHKSITGVAKPNRDCESETQKTRRCCQILHCA